MENKKTQVFYNSLTAVDKLIKKYQESMDSIRESMEANDIHNDYDQEGRGQLLGDFERTANHLDHAQKMKEKLSEVDRGHYSEQIQFGSFIETKKNYYFIAVPLGEVELDDGSTVQVISTEAPIYQQLEEKRKGDTFTLNDKEEEIIDVH